VSDNENLHLVILEGSGKKARPYADILEGAGYTVQLDRVQGIEALEALFKETDPDLVFYGNSPRIPELEVVSAWLAKHAGGTPLVVLASDPAEVTPDVVQSGACAVVSADQPDHLVSTIRKLLDDAALKRRIRRLEEAVETIHLQQRIDRLERALWEKEKDCVLLVDNSRDAIAYVYNGNFLYANPACLTRFGMDDLAKLKGTALLGQVDPEDHAAVERLLYNCHEAGDAVAVKIGLANKEGVSRSTAVEFAPASFGNKRCIRMTIRAPVQATGTGMAPETFTQEQLFPGAYNRHHFMQAVEESLKSSGGTDIYQTVTYVLLDDFRTIRDNFGIYAGDQMIRNITALIKDNYDNEDTVAQFGDYVYAILSRSQNEDHAYLLADSLRKKIKKHVTVVGGQIIQTTCSIGMCVINEHMMNAQDVLSRADLACEVARSSGGNLVHIHSTVIEKQLGREIEPQCGGMIRKTLEDERLYLVYQPIVSLKDKTSGRYEVLLRVVDENGQVIFPGQFISLAGKTGMSTEIDRWVISTTLASLRANHGECSDTAFFVKVAGATLSDGEFPAWLEQQLKDNGLPGSVLILEIPETTAVRNSAVTSGFINATRAIGCRIAIEHFGYTSPPEMLLDLDMDFLKIDGSLIDNLAYSSENQARVRSVVEFARATRTQCIAERVDDASSLVTLWQYNVDYIQGNFLREPGKKPDYDFEDAIALHNLAES
jgi:diguanylate cyclase (GGDEF)-like protein